MHSKHYPIPYINQNIICIAPTRSVCHFLLPSVIAPKEHHIPSWLIPLPPPKWVPLHSTLYAKIFGRLISWKVSYFYPSLLDPSSWDDNPWSPSLASTSSPWPEVYARPSKVVFALLRLQPSLILFYMLPCWLLLCQGYLCLHSLIWHLVPCNDELIKILSHCCNLSISLGHILRPLPPARLPLAWPP